MAVFLYGGDFVKIAIYSRKSKFTGKGESIENQIQLCKEYAESHFKNPDFTIYFDEGFSGGNADRPQFQKMLRDAKEKKFDVLVCYRLDRVSRNIADFSALIEELQEHGISFVSIREQFDTSTPMGRAMMYIASVFAQLERETIAERIKDNMLELAKTGRWLGGVPPLGFDSERITYIDKDFKERSLVVLKPIEKEMEMVECFCDKYIELGSIHKLRKYLIQNDIRTRNGKYYSNSVLIDILRNPVYVKANKAVVEYLEAKGIEIAGKENLNGKRAILLYNKRDKHRAQNEFDEWIGAVAKHNGRLEPDKWLKVQYMLDRNTIKLPRTGTSEVALLSGLLKCAKCGSAMNVMYGRKRKDGTAPHYYVCGLKTSSGSEKCQNENINGDDIDNTVIEKLISLSKSKDALLEELERLKKSKNNYFDVNVLDKLKNQKDAILEEISNLVKEVSKSAVASKYILPQIEARDAELKKLDEQIAKLENEQNKIKNETDVLNLVIDNIVNFKNVVDTLSNREKKSFLRTIIDKVYWDGDTGQVAIVLLTGTKEVSKFRPPPSWEQNKTGIILYNRINKDYRYKDYPEDTLGQKIKKQRLLLGLTAAQLGKLCNRKEVTINFYESDIIQPDYSVMQKLCKLFNVPIEYFDDDYYTFVLSDGYEEFLRQWRKKNTKRHYDIKEILGISFWSYNQWEKGRRMSRETFEKIREKLGI